MHSAVCRNFIGARRDRDSEGTWGKAWHVVLASRCLATPINTTLLLLSTLGKDKVKYELGMVCFSLRLLL